MEISRIFAARSLPIPGISRSAVSSRVASSCGWLLAISATLRYARILNGLSPLISRRSATSSRMCAMAALSNPEAFCVDVKVQDASAALTERRGDGGSAVGRAVAEQAAATACPAYFRGRGSGCARPAHEVIDFRGGDARREPFAVFPFLGD